MCCRRASVVRMAGVVMEESFGWLRRCRLVHGGTNRRYRCGAAVVVRCSDVAHLTSTAGREFLGEGANRGPTGGHNQGMTLGAAIRDLRERAGLSQADLATEVCKRSGRDTVSKKEVRRWELGQRNPSLYSLRFIAGALGVDVEDLLSVNRRQFVTAALTEVISTTQVGQSGLTGLKRARAA
jgi:transcriptional regulator with XRE-family HTH domain